MLARLHDQAASVYILPFSRSYMCEGFTINSTKKSLTFRDIEEKTPIKFEIKPGGNRLTVMLPRISRVRIADFQGRPLADVPYHLKPSRGPVREGRTDSEGWTRIFDPVGVTSALLTTGDQTYELQLKDEAPSDSTSAAQSLLNAGGFEAGPIDGELGAQTRAALVAFQRVAGLEVTGEPDHPTLMHLKTRLDASFNDG